MSYKDKALASLIITQITHHDGTKELAIDILKDGYNIISKTIYNEEKAKKILELITED